MNIRQIIKDDDAVSPVIGVILMVAITVILAAVIASFVLGLGDQAQQTTPQASFSFDYEDGSAGSDVLTVTHDGGDTIDEARLSVSADTSFRQGDSNTTAGSAASTITMDTSTSTTPWGQSDDEYSAGDAFALTAEDSGSLDEATVRVVYTGESGDSSSTLATWEGPDA